MELKFEPIVSKRDKVRKSRKKLNSGNRKEKYIMVSMATVLIASGVIGIKLPPEVRASELDTVTVVEGTTNETVSEGEQEIIEPLVLEEEIDIEPVLDEDFIGTISEGEKEVSANEAIYTAKVRDELGLSVNVELDTINEDEIEVLTEDEVEQKETYMKVDSMTVTNIGEAPVTTGYVFGTGPLTEKYSYALYDTGGRRTDIDEYLLKVLEESCEENGVNPHIMLGIIMTESEGHANAKNKSSTATGLCQFLSSSGQWTYETLLGNGAGTYTHEMAYNPEISIRMGAAAMGYWLRTKGNYYRAIQAYRGKNDISGYTSVINSHIGKVGLKVEDFY